MVSLTGAKLMGVERLMRLYGERRGAVARRARPLFLRKGVGLAAAALLTLAACDSTQSESDRGPRTTTGPGMRGGGTAVPPPSPTSPARPYGGYYTPHGRDEPTQRGNTPEGAVFADWVLSTDPQRKYIVDAFVWDNRILGVIVNPTMTRGEAQQMLHSLLTGMRRTFPGRLLEVIAYYESGNEMARITWDAQTKQAQTVWRH